MSRWNPTSNSKSVQSNPLLILISLLLFRSSASAAFSIAPPRFLISNSNFTLIDPISTWKLEYPLFFIFPFYPLDLKSQLGLLCSLFLIPVLSFYLTRDLSFKDMLPNHPMTFINHFNQRLDHIISSINGHGHDRQKDSDEKSSHKPISRLRRSVQHQLPITSFTQSNPPSSSNHKSKSNQKNHSDSSHYPGLYNTGNTCFFNSVVQSVSSCKHFHQYLDNVIDLAEKYDVVTPVTDSIYDLIQELNSPSKQRRAIYPRDLSNSLATLSLQNGTRSLMGAHQQQDSHELFLLLASGIESELIKILKEKERIESESNLGFRGLLNTFTSTSSQSSSRTNELRKLNPLISILAQRTSCLICGYSESIRLFPNEEFSLTVPDRTNRYHLEDCFRDFVELEKIEWYCFRCSLRQSLDKINTEVWKLENVSSSSSSSSGEKKIGTEKGDETSFFINGNGNGNANENENGVQQVIENKLNPSKKRKLREMKKIQTKLKNSISNNLHEDEFHSESLHLTKTNFKLEKSLSRESTKQIMICKPPSILSIHLNRSNYSSYSAYGGPSKNNCRIFFEEFLDLGKFVLDGDSLTLDGRKSISDPQGLLELRGNSNQYLNGNGMERKGNYKPIWYKLKSIVVHYGGHSFGHYVSFRRRPTITSEDQEQLHRDLKDDIYNQPQPFVNGHGYLDDESRFKNKAREDENWDRISDDSVDRCHLNDVLNQNPFLLFYEKVEDLQTRSFNSTKMTNGFHNGEVLNVPKGLERLSNRNFDVGDGRVLERWQEGLKERGANRSYQDEGEVH